VRVEIFHAEGRADREKGVEKDRRKNMTKSVVDFAIL